ncbi:MAG TPA: DUF3099 domain-containing protein [Pilimelia sp.]|nr:DUF3099 domain-containing protein [Pilimelia sp.]
MKRPAHRPVLITDAERSQEDQLRARQVRYVTMMGVRLACLILGAVLISAEAPLLWLWLPLCAVGMVLLPWLAVLLANDRPPKERHRLGYRRRVARQAAPDRALGAEPAASGPAAAARTIDAEP